MGVDGGKIDHWLWCSGGGGNVKMDVCHDVSAIMCVRMACVCVLGP